MIFSRWKIHTVNIVIKESVLVVFSYPEWIFSVIHTYDYFFILYFISKLYVIYSKKDSCIYRHRYRNLTSSLSYFYQLIPSRIIGLFLFIEIRKICILKEVELNELKLRHWILSHILQYALTVGGKPYTFVDTQSGNNTHSL